MIPKLDLFHQLFYRSPEGFVAVLFYTERFPEANVYTPHGEWCGCSNCSSPSGLLSAVKQIIKFRINWEKQRFDKNYE